MRFGFWPNPRSDYEATKTLAQHAEATAGTAFGSADHFLPEEQALIPCTSAGSPWPRWREMSREPFRHLSGEQHLSPSCGASEHGRHLGQPRRWPRSAGLGAGWQQNEHEAYGLDYGSVGSRLDRLEEACQIIKGLFSNEHFPSTASTTNCRMRRSNPSHSRQRCP